MPGFWIERVDEVTPELVAAFGRLIPQLTPDPPPEVGQLERVVEAEASTLLVARNEGGAIVGTLALVVAPTPLGTHAWIEDVVVDERERGRGIGESLTREALRIARERGAWGVSLTSGPAREAANRLYRRLGFEEGGTNYYWLEL